MADDEGSKPRPKRVKPDRPRPAGGQAGGPTRSAGGQGRPSGGGSRPGAHSGAGPRPGGGPRFRGPGKATFHGPGLGSGQPFQPRIPRGPDERPGDRPPSGGRPPYGNDRPGRSGFRTSRLDLVRPIAPTLTDPASAASTGRDPATGDHRDRPAHVPAGPGAEAAPGPTSGRSIVRRLARIRARTRPKARDRATGPADRIEIGRPMPGPTAPGHPVPGRMAPGRPSARPAEPRSYGPRPPDRNRPAGPYRDRPPAARSYGPPGRPEFDRPGFDRPGFDRPGFDRPRPPAFARPGLEPAEAGLVDPGDEVVAGRRPVEEAFVARRDARRLLVVPQRRGALEKLVLHATSLRIPIVEIEGGSLTALTGFDGHQGIALVVAPRRYASVADILARAAERGEPPFVLVLDSLEDPQNVGTLLRSAEAAGAHGVLFPTHRQAPISPAAIKASAGAVEHLLLAPVDDLAAALADLHVAGLRVIGAEAEAALTVREADLRGPIALVVGSEGQGLGPAVRRRCDLTVRIPMRGVIGSLNASVAGSILLFEATTQRAAADQAPGRKPRAPVPRRSRPNRRPSPSYRARGQAGRPRGRAAGRTGGRQRPSCPRGRAARRTAVQQRPGLSGGERRLPSLDGGRDRHQALEAPGPQGQPQVRDQGDRQVPGEGCGEAHRQVWDEVLRQICGEVRREVADERHESNEVWGKLSWQGRHEGHEGNDVRGRVNREVCDESQEGPEVRGKAGRPRR